MAAIIFVTALTVRVIFWRQWNQTPFVELGILDSEYFDRQAVTISNGQWWPDKVFYVPPVYPYILAVIYKLFGHGFEPVRLIQNILGSVNCLLVALIAIRLFGRSAGLLAGLIAALYGPFIFYDSMVLKTTWDLLFTALYLIYSLKTTAALRITDAALSGLFLGIATLLRGNMIFLIPFMPFWWLFAMDLQGGNRSTALQRAWFKQKRSRLNLVCAYGLGVAICLVPITASNYLIGNDFVLTGYSAGPNLWLGNNAEAMGILAYPSDMTPKERNMEGEEAYFRTRAEQAAGQPLKPSEISRFWVGKAIKYVFSEPLDWSFLTLKKIFYLLNNHEFSDNYDMKFIRQEFGTVLNAPLFCFGIVASLAAIGCFCAFRRKIREAKLLVSLSLVYVGSVLPFIIIDRYRLPMLVFMIPFAAHAIVTMVQEFRSHKKEHFRVYGIIFVVVAMLSWAPLIDTDIGIYSEYSNLGSAYLVQNDLPKAKLYFEKALEVMPDYPIALRGLGYVLFAMGENVQALAMSQRIRLDCVRYEPQSEPFVVQARSRRGRVISMKISFWSGGVPGWFWGPISPVSGRLLF